VIKKLNTAKKSANADQDYLASTMGKLFEQFRERILRLVNNSEYSDGVEIIPMLITTEMLVGNHHAIASGHSTAMTPTTATSISSTPSTTLSPVDEESSPTPVSNAAIYEVDMVGTLLGACKSILQDRLNEFVRSQIAWIHQCREDPKKSIVLLPFAKFPAFVDQMKELSGDKVPVPSPCPPSPVAEV
jgi:hypothetical protein